MVKLGALFLLLAVAASQVGLSSAKNQSLLECPMNFYGRTFTMLDMEFRNSTAEICFKNSTSTTTKECIHLNQDKATDFKVDFYNIPMTADTSKVQNIKETMSDCSVKIMTVFYQEGKYLRRCLIMRLYKYGRQTFFSGVIDNNYNANKVTVTTKVGDLQVFSSSYLKSQRRFDIDLSGCRRSEAPTAVHSSFEEPIPNTCLIEQCPTGVTIYGNTCGPLEDCLVNNTKCLPRRVVCTVTGSSVIDFFNRQRDVPDRCVYSLMNPQDGNDFDILAGFQERRRRDVMFLDNLILVMGGEVVHLEQGGKVRTKNGEIMLNSTAQMVHGMELSKNETGVIAAIPAANATVFFDGHTAHVVAETTGIQGLCGISNDSTQTTSLLDAKSDTNSSKSCHVLQTDTANSTINCTRATALCNLMSQAPFAACHSHIAPQPYIGACTSTLCRYPLVDNLKCKFFEAYTKACNLINVTLEDWRSRVACPDPPLASCQDHYCADNEFCAESLDGPRCLCKGSFAAKYKPTNSFGDPTVCMQSSANITLAGCLLEEQGIDYSTLHLKNQSCTGHMDHKTHMVTFSFDSTNTCGAEVMMNNSQVIFKNTIMTRNISNSSVIVRQDQVEIDFSCFYKKPDVKSVSFKIKDSSVVQRIVSGVWNYTLTMKAYTNPDHTGLVGPSTTIQLNQRVYVELKTEGLDEKMVAIVTDSCWATNQQSVDGLLRYYLIKDECPSDQTVKVGRNGVGTSNSFSFNMFAFAGQNSDVFLHCKLQLCIKQGKSCAPVCNKVGTRKRRSSHSNLAVENAALITMVWSN